MFVSEADCVLCFVSSILKSTVWHSYFLWVHNSSIIPVILKDCGEFCGSVYYNTCGALFQSNLREVYGFIIIIIPESFNP